ncbi:MAG: hypothetical protein ACRCX2_10150 [Paraclostridium sp.]
MIMTVSEICSLIGMEEKQFLKFTKRYEQKITDLGYTFTKEGKGKKAIYTLDNADIKENNNTQLKELLVSEYGFNGRYKIDEYIELINYLRTTDGFNTNAEIGQSLGLKEHTVMRYIKTLRDKLILKPKNICPIKYYGTSRETNQTIDISEQMYDNNYHQAFYFQESACENCIGQARKQILEYLGVINLWKIYKQEFTTEFLNKALLGGQHG